MIQAPLIVGKSKELVKILKIIEKVAPFKSTVLITGESGTGKELFAKALHVQSPRVDGPMIIVNCGAIPENLLESELFGHVKGAFTGAVSTKEGLFEKANQGTLFLDEIGELPLDLQVKILRAIQEEEIMRVGDRRPIKLDIRIIAATNKSLEEEVHSGQFRQDLYYRLNVVNLAVPSMVERADDLPLLASHFIAKFSKMLDRDIQGINGEALGMLRNYDWPGNIRELENVIEQTIILMDDSDIIEGRHLPVFLERRGYEKRNRFRQESLDRKLSIDDYTKEFILQFQSKHTEKELAEYLGITTKTLWEKRKRWDLKRSKK